MHFDPAELDSVNEIIRLRHQLSAMESERNTAQHEARQANDQARFAVAQADAMRQQMQHWRDKATELQRQLDDERPPATLIP